MRLSVSGLQPHLTGDGLGGVNRDPAGVQPGSMQIEPCNAKALADLRGLPRGGKKLVRALVVGETAAEIAVTIVKSAPGALQRIQVVRRPVPEADAEPEFGEPTDPPFDGLVEPEHFGACGESEGLRHRRDTSIETRPSRTRGPTGAQILAWRAAIP